MLLQWFYFLIPLAIEKKLKAAQELSENFEVTSRLLLLLCYPMIVRSNTFEHLINLEVILWSNQKKELQPSHFLLCCLCFISNRMNIKSQAMATIFVFVLQLKLCSHNEV